jgi:hypothetical protein
MKRKGTSLTTYLEAGHTPNLFLDSMRFINFYDERYLKKRFIN